MSHRVVALGVGGVAMALLLVGAYVSLGRERSGHLVTTSGDLASVVRTLVQQMPPPGSNGYRQPTPQEQTQMADAARALVEGRLDDAAAAAAAFHYEVVRFTDTVTGRKLLMLQEEQNLSGSWPEAWGLYVVAPESQSHLLVEVAHPYDDINTAPVGVETFRQADAKALLIAGASRYANEGDVADIAHDAFSVFEAIHERLLTADSVVFEPHGFEVAKHASLGDMVVSSGTAPSDRTAQAVADALTEEHFTVCLYDGSNCSDLGATTNVQGVSTRERGATFLHIEMAPGMRSSRAKRDAVARAVAIAAG